MTYAISYLADKIDSLFDGAFKISAFSGGLKIVGYGGKYILR